MTTESNFSGTERLELFPVIGRLIRKGSRAELAVSDAERVRQALRTGDIELARRYLSIVRPGAEGMVILYSEFVLAFLPELEKRGPEVDPSAVYARAHESWAVSLRNDPELDANPALARRVAELFAPSRVDLGSIAAFRQSLLGGGRTLATELIEEAAADFDALEKAMERRDSAAAEAVFDRYYSKMRQLHDLLVELVSVLATTIAERHGQAAAEESLRAAFTGCLFYEGLWAGARMMSYEELAAFLADHLRAHFSGSDRGGSVEIVEESDRWHLRVSPCGSGGAMRARARSRGAKSALPLAGASPQTWSRVAEVPGYCSHCAVNELESMKRLGYPVLITDFDPDPAAPCGWTVYKDPSLIPDQFFERLGFQKDASRFVLLKT